jgi:tetratricopeptide (TPR) repeat protein
MVLWYVLVSVALMVTVFLIYGPLCGDDSEFFRLDDGEYVVNNQNVQAGLTLKGIGWAFTTFEAVNWHPLTWMSLQLDADLHGLAPGGYHLTNTVLHAAASLLLLFVLTRMTGYFWPSALVAALFALHPLRVESVAWIAERKDVLSTFFWIATMGAYTWYVQQPSVKRYSLVILCFVLGLLSKPMVVTLPFALLLLDLWPLNRQRPWRTLVMEKIPLFMLSALACWITIQAQAIMLETLLTNQPLGRRALNACWAYGQYLLKTVWPVNLAPMYSRPLAEFPMTEALISAGVLLIITVTAVVQVRKRPYLAVGWFWFLGTMVPVIGLVQVGIQTMADRYTYVPHIGLLLMLVWLLRDLLVDRVRYSALAVLATVLLLGCVLLSVFQASLWRNSLALWNHAVTSTRNNFAAHHFYGVTLASQNQMADAIEQYRFAVKLEPQYVTGHVNLGRAYQTQQRWAEAAASYAKAVELRPQMTEAQQELAMCYLTLQQYVEALPPLSALVKQNPDNAVAHGNYSLTLMYAGQWQEAEQQARQALERDPQLHDARRLLGMQLAQQKKYKEAEECFQKSLTVMGRIDPTSAYYLAYCQKMQGQERQAADMIRQISILFPRWSSATREEAWRLATHQEEKRRNGQLALLKALVITHASQFKDVDNLAVLAAAHAETRDYGSAVKTQQQALDLLKNEEQSKREKLQRHLQLYKEGKPVRE